jgi:hypothetical protein
LVQISGPDKGTDAKFQAYDKEQDFSNFLIYVSDSSGNLWKKSYSQARCGGSSL